MSTLQKRLGLLALVLVLLVGIAKLTSDKRLETTKGGGFTTLIDKSVDMASIDVLRAWVGAKADSAVEIRRSGDKWVVPTAWDWPAKETQVKQLLDDLTGLSGEERPSNDKVLADFQVDDEKGLHVSGSKSGGPELFHVIAGKSARGGDFVRKEGSKNVYLSTKSIRSKFGIWGDDPKPPQASRWIDLNVFKADRANIDKVVLRSDKGEVTLERVFAPMPTPAAGDSSVGLGGPPPVDRNNYTYRADSKGDIDKGKADQVVNTLSSLYASSAIDPQKPVDLGLGATARSVEVTMADGTKTNLLFGKPATDESRVYFQVEGGKPAEINKVTVDRIFVERKDLSPGATTNASAPGKNPGKKKSGA